MKAAIRAEYIEKAADAVIVLKEGGAECGLASDGKCRKSGMDTEKIAARIVCFMAALVNIPVLINLDMSDFKSVLKDKGLVSVGLDETK